MVLEKTLESPLEFKEIQPVHSEGDQPWSFSFSINPSKEIPGLISFGMDWLDLLAVQEDSQESSPTPQFKSINSLVLSLPHSPTLTSVEKAMATHSSTLAWKIPWTEEPGRLQSMVSLRVEHN